MAQHSCILQDCSTISLPPSWESDNIAIGQKASSWKRCLDGHQKFPGFYYHISVQRQKVSTTTGSLNIISPSRFSIRRGWVLTRQSFHQKITKNKTLTIIGLPWKFRTSSRRYWYARCASSSELNVTYQLLLCANSQLANRGQFSPENRSSTSYNDANSKTRHWNFLYLSQIPYKTSQKNYINLVWCSVMQVASDKISWKVSTCYRILTVIHTHPVCRASHSPRHLLP